MNDFLEFRHSMMELKCAVTALRSDLKYRKLMNALATDFKRDPNQPRHPAVGSRRCISELEYGRLVWKADSPSKSASKACQALKRATSH